MAWGFGYEDVNRQQISDTGQNQNFLPGFDPKVTAREQAPWVLQQEFARIAQEGIDPGFAGRNQAAGLATANLANRRLSRGTRRRVSRRLGPRSGAVETQISNNLGPILEALAARFQQDQFANFQSRAGGLEGLFQILESSRRNEASKRADDSSFIGDIAGLAGTVGGFILGGPPGAAAGGTVGREIGGGSPRNLA